MGTVRCSSSSNSNNDNNNNKWSERNLSQELSKNVSSISRVEGKANRHGTYWTQNSHLFRFEGAYCVVEELEGFLQIIQHDKFILHLCTLSINQSVNQSINHRFEFTLRRPTLFIAYKQMPVQLGPSSTTLLGYAVIRLFNLSI